MKKYYYVFSDNGKIWSAIRSTKPLSEYQVALFSAELLDMDVELISQLFSFESMDAADAKWIGGWEDYVSPTDEISAHRCSRN